MKHRNWFWGLFFILAGIFVVATQTGSFLHIGILTIAATILLAVIIIHSITDLNFFGIFIPLALLYMIYTGPLNLPFLSPWLLLLAGLLTSIGFSIIFGNHWDRHKEWICSHHDRDYRHVSEQIDDNNPYCKVSFGSSSTYLHGDSLKSGQFIASFGSLEVYFDEAHLSPEGAEIYLDSSFGSIELYIPKNWRVIDNLHCSLGGVDNDKRFAQPDQDAPRLTLSGNVSFGAVQIHYI